jgi:hypothetical protein
MPREIVTSENREDFIEKKLAEKDGSDEKMKDPQLYKYYAKKAEALSAKASTNMEHYDAHNAHSNAAMYAGSHPVSKEHEEKRKQHAIKMRTAKKVETEKHIASYMENRDKAQTSALIKKGILSKAE